MAKKQEHKRVHVNKYESERPKGQTLAEIEADDPGRLARDIARAVERRDRALHRPFVLPTPRSSWLPSSGPMGSSSYGGSIYSNSHYF